MLLAVDEGNSDVKFGLFEGPKLLKVWRFPTETESYGDDYAIHVETRFSSGRLHVRDVEAIIISSVRYNYNSKLRRLAEEFFNLRPIVVWQTMRTGLTILYDDPSELGTDRLVDSVAAVEKYGAPCIVVDFGTATTFNAINSKREYLGGMIVPGIMTGLKSLVAHTSRLRDVEFGRPQKVIGSSTYDCLQSGLFFGTIDVVDSLIKRIRDEMGGSPKVIATGGLARLLQDRSQYIEVFDPTLTLDGLRIVYEMNKA